MSSIENILIDIGMYVTYALLAFATITAIAFPIFFILKNPKKAGGSLIGVIIIASIYVVSYIFSSGTETQTISAGVSRHISAALYTTYILVGIALLLAIVTSFVRLRK